MNKYRRQYHQCSKNEVSLKTKGFINERLEFVGKKLDSINNDLKDFKTKNKLTDIKAESQLVLENFSNTSNSIVESTIQLKLVQSLNNELNYNNLIRSVVHQITQRDGKLYYTQYHNTLNVNVVSSRNKNIVMLQ